MLKDPQKAVQNPHRLSVLEQLELLDTPIEEAFDRLTRLAGLIIGVPVSLVSLVDADRQFFKSQIGLPEPVASRRETPLSHSFCQHVVATREPLIVEDARQHPVLKHNKAVPDLNVISYLGLPLTTSDGVTLGSFCVIDSQPRSWTQEEIEIIRELAQSVMTEIELRYEIKNRAQIEQTLQKTNGKYRRVHHFAGATLRHIEDMIGRGAEKEELLHYLTELQDSFDKIEDNEPTAVMPKVTAR